ncbi:MAG TPA: hypothetical protein VFF30_03105 [Nitrososphaerales archaeon]|nr:hypothetical protein [Nitrososphaerales archaeon]
MELSSYNGNGGTARKYRSSREPPLSELPEWALRADLAFARQKLSMAVKRKQDGGLPHARFESYDLVLKERIVALEKEIRNRTRRRTEWSI